MGRGAGDGYHQRAAYSQCDDGARYERDDRWQGFEETRHCRDKLCAIVFVLAIAGFVVVSAIAFTQGDLSVISAGVNEGNKVTKDFDKLKDGRWVITVCAICTAVLGFIWLELLKRCTKVFVWASFFLAFALMLAAGASVFHMGTKHDATSALGLKIAGAVIMALAVVVLVLLFCMRRRIAFSAEVIQQGCRGLQHNFAVVVLVLPLLLAITVGFLIWWILAVVYLFSVKGDSIDCPSKPADDCEYFGCTLYSNQTCAGEGWDVKESVRWSMFFMVFMLFWCTVFMAGVSRFSIASVLARWYWNPLRDNASVGVGASLTGMCWAFSYHLGTIAKGSFVIAVIKFITYLLEKAREEEVNPALKCVLCMVTCCCRCIEAIVQFVTRFAFICSAMHGKDFFDSCRDVSQLFSRQGGQMFLTDMIAHLVVRMGMFLSVGIAVLGGAWYMQNHDGVSTTSVLILIVICAVVFWIIGLAVEVAADTVIVCYLEDRERNDATRSYRGPDDLMSTLQYCCEQNAQAAPAQKLQTYNQSGYGGAGSAKGSKVKGVDGVAC
eukprot:TRINITY_DN8677_c0_g1_i1.p1 TRINITY_DN8677_c0_g1~~TRINITY_DN8677_c0_g1_i1.p1  ORF type:complete len:569 (+),score=192.07 TRINITY_DN8677_c0_g1_i1:57-1709(+)